MSRPSLPGFAFAALCFGLVLAARALAGVVPASPGAADRLVEASGPCPTFSWSGTDGAIAYELAVLDLTDSDGPQLVFSERIAGASGSWTPSRDRCLAPGRTYAWLVRADVAGSGLGEWSAPRRFRVPGAPSLDEVSAALEVLERWHASQGAGAATGGTTTAAAAQRAPTPVPEEHTTGAAEAPLATGVAAIRGEIPDTTGSAYGVFGITHSAAGAAVVARNEAIGPDLVLDGAAQGQADTLLTQNGIDRSSAANQTFDLGNSGAGSLNVTVDGVAVSKDGHAHAGEAITSGTVADARIASTLARDGEVVGLVLAGDGEGSGLDADHLDGMSSGSFANAGHTHIGDPWFASDIPFLLRLQNSSADGEGLLVGNYQGNGIVASGAGAQKAGVQGVNNDPNGRGVYGYTDSTLGFGVYGAARQISGEAVGVFGVSESSDGDGGLFQNWGGGVALSVDGGGSLRAKPALRVNNTDSLGIAAYLTANSSVAAMHVGNAGGGEVLYLQNGGTDEFGNGGNDFIRAVNHPENDSQFRVLTSGEVRSDVGFYTPAADFAEMLPAAAGLEAGDVLAIGPDGRLVRAAEPFAGNVAGVFSTAPGFVGGHPVESGARAGEVPLALVGIVPVKVSAENGPIAPGDLLVAAATPGHAMRAGSSAPNGTVLGKALEPHPAGLGRIRMLLVLQ